MSRKSRRVTFKFVSHKPVKQLQVGDQLWAKGKSARITAAFVAQGKKVFETDMFGMVFADEVEMK